MISHEIRPGNAAPEDRKSYLKRHRGRLRLVAVAVALIAGGSLASAVPAVASTGQAHAGTGSSVTAQCAKPLDARSGAWICNQTPAGTLRAAASTGYCKLNQGCWSLDSSAGSASWGWFVEYGYGETVLGVNFVSFTTTLSGRQSVSKVLFDPTTAVYNLVEEGNRLSYSSRYPAGTPIRPSVYEFHDFYPFVLPGEKIVEWPHGGYIAFEKVPISNGAVKIQWNWGKTDYPGTWWIYAKSIHYYYRTYKGRLTNAAFFYKNWQKLLGELPVAYGYSA